MIKCEGIKFLKGRKRKVYSVTNFKGEDKEKADRGENKKGESEFLEKGIAAVKRLQKRGKPKKRGGKGSMKRAAFVDGKQTGMV